MNMFSIHVMKVPLLVIPYDEKVAVVWFVQT